MSRNMKFFTEMSAILEKQNREIRSMNSKMENKPQDAHV